MSNPPGNSLKADQGARVAEPGDTLVDGLDSLIARIREELDYNDAKGQNAYRSGLHDGLRFAEDALIDQLRRHGHPSRSRPTALDV